MSESAKTTAAAPGVVRVCCVWTEWRPPSCPRSAPRQEAAHARVAPSKPVGTTRAGPVVLRVRAGRALGVGQRDRLVAAAVHGGGLIAGNGSLARPPVQTCAEQQQQRQEGRAVSSMKGGHRWSAAAPTPTLLPRRLSVPLRVGKACACGVAVRPDGAMPDPPPQRISSPCDGDVITVAPPVRERKRGEKSRAEQSGERRTWVDESKRETKSLPARSLALAIAQLPSILRSPRSPLLPPLSSHLATRTGRHRRPAEG